MTSTSTVSAGVARAVITPPLGIPLVGFAGTKRATDVHDDLLATALVLRGPDVGAAIVCCDLLDIPAELADRIRRSAAQASGIAAANILISASHTHYGPQVDPDSWEVPDRGPLVTPYIDTLQDTITRAVASAARRCAPARVFVGAGEADIGINRRQQLPDGRVVLGQNPDGPIDRRVKIVRVDATDGRPIAVVVNHACHGVSLGADCTSITADFPAALRRAVEVETGATCLFMQGAAGDINPRLMSWDFHNVDSLGGRLATAACAAYGRAEEREGRLVAASATLDLPMKLPISIDAAIEELTALRQRAEAVDPGVAGDELWRAHRMSQLTVATDVLRGIRPALTVPAELTAIALGDGLGLVTAPAEMFTELGTQIVTGSPLADTLYSGYTNGMIGYVPTRAAYPHGGYEVTHGSRVAPEAGEQIAERSLDLLAEVEAGPSTV